MFPKSSRLKNNTTIHSQREEKRSTCSCFTVLNISVFTAGNHVSTPQHPDNIPSQQNVIELIMAVERWETQLMLVRIHQRKLFKSPFFNSTSFKALFPYLPLNHMLPLKILHVFRTSTSYVTRVYSSN